MMSRMKSCPTSRSGASAAVIRCFFDASGSRPIWQIAAGKPRPAAFSCASRPKTRLRRPAARTCNRAAARSAPPPAFAARGRGRGCRPSVGRWSLRRYSRRAPSGGAEPNPISEAVSTTIGWLPTPNPRTRRAAKSISPSAMTALPGGGWSAVIVVPMQVTRSRSLGFGTSLSERPGGAATAAVPIEAHIPKKRNRPNIAKATTRYLAKLAAAQRGPAAGGELAVSGSAHRIEWRFPATPVTSPRNGQRSHGG